MSAGACFHIRLRLAAGHPFRLTDPSIGRALLDAARHYDRSRLWGCRLTLLMPDHVHALLEFPAGADMSRVIGDWKRFTARRQGIVWQTNYFDHRIRDRHKLQETAIYIRRNPVVKGLCEHAGDWPWVWPADARK